MKPPINADSRVADVFENYPGTRDVFRRFGFGALMNPVMRKTLGKVTTVERGCRMHGVDVDEFLTALRAGSGTEEAPPTAPPGAAASEPPEAALLLEMGTGELAGRHPAVKEVFVKFFGGGCFSCPAFGQETVRFACSMHGADPLAFAAECLALIVPRRFTGEETVRDLVARAPQSLPVLHRFGVDSCCGGVHPLEKAAQAHGVSLPAILKALEARVSEGA